MTDKHNIPKGKMHSNCRLLPEDIVCRITQRNNIRKANTCDPVLKLYRRNTHIPWKTIHGLSNRTPPTTHNNSITCNNKIANTPKHIANCFTKQFTNTVKHATHTTNRSIDRAPQNIQGYNITLTSAQLQEAIKQCKATNHKVLIN